MQWNPPQIMNGVFHRTVPKGWSAWHVNTLHITVCMSSMSLTLLRMGHVQILWAIFMNTAQLVPVTKMLPNSRSPVVCHTKNPLQQTRCSWRIAPWSAHCLCSRWKWCLLSCVEVAYPLVNSPTWKDVTLYTQYNRRVVKGISVTWCFQIFPLTKDTSVLSLFCWYPGYKKDCCTSLL